VLPAPVPGGDVVLGPPAGVFNQFFSGVGAGFDELNAEPQGITNFNGVIALGYTSGSATDNSGTTYQVITDVRVYQGDYVGAQATFPAGGTTSARAHGTFVEIWIDLWLPSFGAPVQQVHDFNPGIGSNGLFWIVQVPDDAVKITDDTLTISLRNVAVVDQFQFPGGAGNNLGTAGVPATVSFDITYRKSGVPRHVRPTSADPLSPFNWAGEMWTATNSGTFSVTYNDQSFSVQGSFSSSGFGEMGKERNGSFVQAEREGLAGPALPAPQNPTGLAGGTGNQNATKAANSPMFKGKIPVEYFVHWRVSGRSAAELQLPLQLAAEKPFALTPTTRTGHSRIVEHEQELHRTLGATNRLAAIDQ
jgi:hypothetical protein